MFKKRFHRIVEELKSLFLVGKYIGFYKSFSIFWGKVTIQRMVKDNYIETNHRKDVLLKKHKFLLEFLKKYLNDFKYNEYTFFDDEISYDQDVFVCWWQGYDRAPEVVKYCINSIRRNLDNSHRLFIVTQENYKKYANVPDWIMKKKEKGEISETHFSDILRFCILAQHGGMWLDSTFFCNDARINNVFDFDFWTIKRPNYLHCSPSCGNFATYSLYCKHANRSIFKVAFNLLLAYWEKSSYLVDYLLIEYAFLLVLDSSDDFLKLINSVPKNNTFCDDLVIIIDEDFDKAKYNFLINNTFLFKLTRKRKFNAQDKSYFSRLLKGECDDEE